MDGTIYTSRCCGSCLHAEGEDSLRCEKGGNLIVDAFYVCPLYARMKFQEVEDGSAQYI